MMLVSRPSRRHATPPRGRAPLLAAEQDGLRFPLVAPDGAWPPSTSAPATMLPRTPAPITRAAPPCASGGSCAAAFRAAFRGWQHTPAGVPSSAFPTAR